MFAAERVRIVTVGQQQNFDIHSLCQQHVGTAHGGMDACLVAVVEQHDVLREAPQQLDLVDGKGGAGVGYYVLQAALVHGDDVGVALDHVDAILLDDGFLGLVDAVELALLMVYLGVGGVDVFLLYALGGCVQLTSTEGHDLAADVHPGKDGAAGKAVVHPMLVADAETGGQQELFLKALAVGLVGKGIALGECKTQLELVDDIVADASAAEILLANGLAVDVVQQYLMKILAGPFVDHKHGLTFRLLTLLVVGKLALLNIDVVFLG